MTIDPKVAAAQPEDPDGDWTKFWQALSQPEPAPVTPQPCRTCLGRGYYNSGGTTFRHCSCARGDDLRASRSSPVDLS